jgi:hypothetical protein
VQPEEKRDERGEKGEKAGKRAEGEPREGKEKNKHEREMKGGKRGAWLSLIGNLFTSQRRAGLPGEQEPDR